MPQNSPDQDTARAIPPPLPLSTAQPPELPPVLPQVEQAVITDARFQLAFMALTARRYDEAVRRFAEILSVSPSPKVWLGLGASKIGAFMSGTVAAEEIVFCFHQAKASGTEADRSLTYTAFLATVDDFLLLSRATLQDLWSCESSAADARRRGMLAIGASVFTNNSRNIAIAVGSANLLNQGANRVAESRAIRQNVDDSKKTLYSRLVGMRSAVPQVLPHEHPGLMKSIAAIDQVILALYPQAVTGAASSTSSPSPNSRQWLAGNSQSPTKGTSGFAVGSLICGLLSIPVFPLFIPAIILGHVARARIKRSNGAIGGAWMALIGLASGYAVFAVLIGLGVYVAMKSA